MSTDLPMGSTPRCALSEFERVTFAEFFNMTYVNFAPFPPSQAGKATFLFFCGLILAIGLLANVLIIIWIVKGKAKRSSIDIYIVSLSITDLLYVATIIPLQVALLSVDTNWGSFPESHAQPLCKGGAYFLTACICISLLTLVVIAIDRYIAICHPLFHYSVRHRRNTTNTALIAFIWLIGLSISVKDVVEHRLSLPFSELDNYAKYGYTDVGNFITEELTYVPDIGYYNTHNHKLIPAADPDSCKDLHYYRHCIPDKRTKTLNYTILFVLVYVLPQVVMGFCYICIAHRLWIRKPVGDADALVTSSPNARMKKSTRKNATILMIMVIAFGLLWLPYWCKRLYDGYRNDVIPDKVVKFDYIDISFTLLSYLSIVSTPVIYMLMDGAFRKYMREKVKAWVRCVLPSPALDNQNTELTQTFTQRRVAT